MNEEKKIKDTLDVIRKALESEDDLNSNNLDNNILVLDKLVKEDGTINFINQQTINKEDINKILNSKLDLVFEKYFTKWLDKNIPNYLEKYFNKKKF